MCWKGAGDCWRGFDKGAAKLGRHETRGTKMEPEHQKKRGRSPLFLFFLVDLGERVLEDRLAQGGEPGGEGDGVEGVGLVEVVLVG